KFTFDVAMSGTMGMDMDLSKLSKEELAFAKSAVVDYKQFRDVVVTGDLYRVESPYGADGGSSWGGSLMFGMPDQSRAVAFVYQTENGGSSSPIVLRGLSAEKRYMLHERDLGPGGASKWEMDGKTVDGATLMKAGITLPALKQYESAVIELVPENA